MIVFGIQPDEVIALQFGATYIADAGLMGAAGVWKPKTLTSMHKFCKCK